MLNSYWFPATSTPDSLILLLINGSGKRGWFSAGQPNAGSLQPPIGGTFSSAICLQRFSSLNKIGIANTPAPSEESNFSTA